ncbi:Tn3 transposase DDE domain protein [Pseudovibrio axinellae]|uniref:Tn3 transposase DDE domain protein n=1 Tax=Pseudovibrio axinellae TaxID=989403 RepID=A0A165UWZ6_9HYPH|nr:Tn3 family transposase [Pseudovibrio axinellae]KZL12950.1 Tn3 transposase DDE domain protein [Pseudovibrio axinellae]SER69889.1 Transposase and inactivated derivatives, TnpA family [Pseudovibrio axinellae]
MPRRHILTERQRSALLDLPTDTPSLLKHYTLADDDLQHIRQRRRAENRIGFALQLCALRFPGRALYSGELIPTEVLKFIGAQLGITGDALLTYASRRQTRHEHMEALRSIYGYRVFSGQRARDLKVWLNRQAEDARSNEDLARRLIEECRRLQVILPAISTIERLCAEALVAAERRIEARIAQRLDDEQRSALNALLSEVVDDHRTRFVWLRQFEAGTNSADASRLLDRLEFLQKLKLPRQVIEGVALHRITRLKRQGERYFADGLRDLSDDRRYAILAVCVVEWQASLADTLIETHDRIVGKTWRESKKLCDVQITEAKTTVNSALQSFVDLGGALLEAHEDAVHLEKVVSEHLGWDGLRALVSSASRLTNTLSADPLVHVIKGYNRFRRYAPRMLRVLEIQGASVAEPLLQAANLVRDGVDHKRRPTAFLRKTSKWHRYLKAQPIDDNRLWEVSVLFYLRDAFRSGDIWLRHSRRYADLKQILIPAEAVTANARLAVPFTPESWIADRQARLSIGLRRLAKAARSGTIPSGSIENGVLNVSRLSANPSNEAEDLLLDLYRRIPDTRITDILLEVDAATGFSGAFTHLRTGAPCKDKLGLLNVLLAEGINLGLSKMAEATNTHEYWELMRLSRWHIESEAMNDALAMVVAAQAQLPMSAFWGLGTTASSDGQFFPTTRQGEAMNLINAKYGTEPGLKAYTHVSDQFAPFAIQTIPATVNEAPYIMDGLLMNDTGQRIREQYADTGGFTDHVFAVTSILGYQFLPRIRDLPSKRFYVFNPKATPRELRGLIGGKVKEKLITTNWPVILWIAATMAAGTVAPSQILRKLASYPRQNDLAAALREIGRIERTLFMIDWILDADLQRRAQIGLNKGESHHALKNALRIGRQGEIGDRTTEGQHYRIAGLNLLTAIVIYWTTARLGEAVSSRKRARLPVQPEHLAHVSPLGWAHILLTGEYRWSKKP